MIEQPDNRGSQSASLALRLAAMIYEAVLLFGVGFAVTYAMLASMRWSYPLGLLAQSLLQAALFVTIGAYFVLCWTRSGQTLALKSWRIKIIALDGQPPRIGRAVARYLLSWHLWLPGIVISALLGLNAGWTMLALAIGFLALLAPARFDQQGRLLHDRWAGTRIVRVPA